MPTAARLVAAILFAIVALFAAEAYKPELPEGMAVGALTPVAVLVGLGCGWMVMGRLVGHGMVTSAGQGLRTSLTIVLWVLGIFCIREMLIKSTRLQYDGPLEAIVGIFQLMMEYAGTALTVPVVGVLVVGGMLAGMVAEFAHSRWR